jgi:hypothetical protein
VTGTRGQYNPWRLGCKKADWAGGTTCRVGCRWSGF